MEWLVTLYMDKIVVLSIHMLKVLEYLQKTKTLKMTSFLGQSFAIALN